jgi:hypothetical protein
MNNVVFYNNYLYKGGYYALDDLNHINSSLVIGLDQFLYNRRLYTHTAGHRNNYNPGKDNTGKKSNQLII